MYDEPRVPVAVRDLTDRQLLLHVLEMQHLTLTKIDQLEDRMTALTEATDALKAAIDGVAQRLLPKVAALESALASALSDDADAAAVLADAQAAAADIRTEVDRLNALGAEPSTPVDPAPAEPVDPPEVEVPSEPEAPTEP